MKLTTTIAITTAMLLLYVTTTNAQDLTRKYRAVGPEVVEDVVDAVRRSCVLPLDNLLLRRLAYVESRDGTDSHTFRSGFFGGIWQVTQTMYDQTKTSSYLQQMRAEIYSHLSINWQSTSWQDLQKPLYSGLAAALYIEDTLRTKPHPVGIAAQQNYWAQVYHQGSPPAESFASLAGLMESGCHRQAELDIGFVLDTSSSISTQDFEDAKKFIINTTSFFDINSGLVRVALITYADVARVRVNWDQSWSHVSLDNVITALSYESGATETAKALNLASQLFVNARRNAGEGGILRVLVFITDGKSHDAIDTASAATQLQRTFDGGLLLLSVGVGDQVDLNELHSIASNPACKHTFQVASYDQIDAIREEIQRMTCRHSSSTTPTTTTTPTTPPTTATTLPTTETTSTTTPTTTKTTTTTSTTTITPTTATPTPTTPSKSTQKQGDRGKPGSECVKCGDPGAQVPCTVDELVLAPTVICPDSAPYCMNDIYQSGSDVSHYRRCVNVTVCDTLWYRGTSDIPLCLNFDASIITQNLACHLCCYGDQCNYDDVPPSDTWYKP